MRSSSRLARLSRSALISVLAVTAVAGCDCGENVVVAAPKLEVNPLSVAFGKVAVGTAGEQLVDVTNIGRASLKVESIGFEGEPGKFAVARLLTTSCSGQPRTAGMTLSQGECARFAVRFAPTAKGEASAKVKVKSNGGEALITLNGIGATPGLQVCVVNESGEVDEGNCTDYSADPAKIPTLAFGDVALGDSVTRKLRVRNLDEGALALTNVRVATDEPDFSIVGGPFTGEVAGNSELDLEWAFAPQRDGSLATEAVIPSNDPTTPEVRIPLTGEGKGPRLCFDPETGLDFGDIAVGSSRKLSLTLRNCGYTRFDVTQLEFFEDDRSSIEFAIQHIGPPAGAPTLPLSFAPGAEHKIEITYSPHRVAASGEADTASINVRSGGGSGAIPVIGRGAQPACDGRAPTADLRVFKGATNITSNPTSEPLSTVTVDATNSTFPQTGTRNYQWRLVRQPANGTVSLTNQANPGKKNLFLELAGEYEVEVIAKDEFGCQSEPKTVVIQSIPKGRVHIQLTWPEFFGDVDLHMLGPGGRFYDGGYLATTQSDCFYANCNPTDGLVDWGRNNTTQPDNNPNNDPSLDIDELWGRGPENINHDLPFDGTFKVVTHYYCSRQSGSSLGAVNPVLKVFVNGTKQLEVTKRLTQRDKWEGAIITVSGNGSNITVVPSTAAVTKATGSNEGCTRDTN